MYALVYLFIPLLNQFAIRWRKITVRPNIINLKEYCFEPKAPIWG